MEKVFSMQDIANLVRKARKEQGITQEELAGVAGTGRRFIYDIENGKDSVQIGKLLSVIQVLGLSCVITDTWKIR